MVATRMVATLFLVGVRIVVPNIPILRTENLESNGAKKIWHILSKSHGHVIPSSSAQVSSPGPGPGSWCDCDRDGHSAILIV